MVEGVKVGASAVERTANARSTREFLEKALASVSGRARRLHRREGRTLCTSLDELHAAAPMWDS